MLNAALAGVEVFVATVLLIGLIVVYVWSLRDTRRKLDRLNKIEAWKKRHPRVS